jgi:hypothetical protein
MDQSLGRDRLRLRALFGLDLSLPGDHTGVQHCPIQRQDGRETGPSGPRMASHPPPSVLQLRIVGVAACLSVCALEAGRWADPLLLGIYATTETVARAVLGGSNCAHWLQAGGIARPIQTVRCRGRGRDRCRDQELRERIPNFPNGGRSRRHCIRPPPRANE